MHLTRRDMLASTAASAVLAATGCSSPLPSAGTLSARVGPPNAAPRVWRDYVAGSWGQVHLWLAEPASGAGDRSPLICLHQTPASGDFFREFSAVMAAGRLVICPDTPGYGASTAPGSVPSMAEYGAAMIEALTNLGYGPDRPVDVLGFHTGNFIALEMALQSPGLVRRLVMPGLPYFTAEELPRMRESFGKPRPFFTDPDYFRRLYTRSIFEDGGGVSRARRLELLSEGLRAGVKSHYGFASLFAYQSDARLAALQHPVLLPVINETLAPNTRRARPLIAHAALTELPELTSASWMLEPEAIAAVVRPWLESAL